jgi:hypothetical protein
MSPSDARLTIESPQEVQAAMAAKASELGAALRAEEKQLAAAASGRLARAAAALEERATAMAALRDRCLFGGGGARVCSALAGAGGSCTAC